MYRSNWKDHPGVATPPCEGGDFGSFNLLLTKEEYPKGEVVEMEVTK